MTAQPMFEPFGEAGLSRQFEQLRRRVGELEELSAALGPLDAGGSSGVRRAIGLARDRFEDSPIPMIDEDWSGAKRLVDRLRAEGVEDFCRYVREHPEVLAELAPAVKVLDVNPAAVRTYKADSKEQLLRVMNAPPDLSTYNPTTGLSDIFVTLIDRFGRGETRVELEGPDTALDGSVIYIRTTTSIARGHEADWGHVLQTVEDFTSRKAAEEALRVAQRMDAIGQLTGGIAHDFNNLLAVIQGNAELLADAETVDRASVRAILRAAQRGAELTQRLLAYARQQPLQPRAIDMAALVGDMWQLFKRTLSENIDIAVSTAPGLWRAEADPGQVENALLNLAINAQHAMPGGGRLTIECANLQLDAAAAAPLDHALPGDYVVVSVTDTGTGMPPEVLEHAFEPFFTTKEVGKGSGLGLSMVYGFARQSGGCATIESEVGRGTCVRLHLPRARLAAASTAACAAAREPRGQGESVLIVEDQPDVRAVTATMVRDLGYRVLEAAEADSAQAILGQREPVDLLLADVILPGRLSGAELAEAARASNPELRVVFMSGYPAESADRRSLVGGDHLLLTKPFHKQGLAQALRTVLDAPS